MQIRTYSHQATSFEQYLGSPFCNDSPCSFESIVALDELQQFPVEFCREIEQWGILAYYVPTNLGGRLQRFDEAMLLFRSIAGRDLTTAIGHAKTFLGAICTWISGNSEQQNKLAKAILAGEIVALGLTERNAGSDLIRNAVFAMRTSTGYQLNGEKWLINNGTRSRFITVYARTTNDETARSHSIFLVDKAALVTGSYTHLPKIQTLGIRGADISGIRFVNASIPLDTRIGVEGSGLETVLKGFQITRPLCASLSLGAADTGLRVGMTYALGRQLYKDSVWQIPHTRRVLTNAYLDLLLCDLFLTITMRVIHIAPEQMSIWAAIAKFWIPSTVESILDQLSNVLASRFFLREGLAGGIFQKVVRDNALVGLFDGSKIVNLYSLAMQLRSLAMRASYPIKIDLRTLCDLNANLPAFDLRNLRLVSYRNCVVQNMPNLTNTFAENVELYSLAQIVSQHLNVIHNKCSSWKITDSHKLDAHYYDISAEYCRLHIAATCLHAWEHGRHTFAAPFQDSTWLTLALGRLLEFDIQPNPADYEKLSARLLATYQQQLSFSVSPWPVAQEQPS